MIARIAIALGFPALVFGQPFIRSVANSASYQNGTISQGSIFTLFGFSMGPQNLTQTTGYPLPTTLAGTSVTVRVGATTVSCPLFYTSNQQVAGVLPSTTPLGSGQLTVNFSNRSGSVAVNVVGSSFGIYSADSSGIGPGIVTSADFKLKTFTSPAVNSETLIVWGTGLGPTDESDAIVPLSRKQFPAEVFVGGQPARILYAGRSGCCAGLDQIAIQSTASPLGCFVPVTVRTPGGISNFVSLSVAAPGRSCTSDAGVPAELLGLASAKVGTFALGSRPILEDAGFSFSQIIAEQASSILGTKVSPRDVAALIRASRKRNLRDAAAIPAKYKTTAKTLDPRLTKLVRAAGDLRQQGAAAGFAGLSRAAILNPRIASTFPAPGTCTLVRDPGSTGAGSAGLDAGPTLTIESPFGRQTMRKFSNGQYETELGTTASGAAQPGFYRITGTGGRDIPAFTASLTVSSSPTWTNKSSITSVDRSQPLTITWAGGPSSGYVLIGGSSNSAGSSGAFVCVESASAGSFTVSPLILSALPAASADDGIVFVAGHPFNNRVTVPGLDFAYFMDASNDSLQVRYR